LLCIEINSRKEKNKLKEFVKKSRKEMKLMEDKAKNLMLGAFPLIAN
jgi:hypothetical protein